MKDLVPYLIGVCIGGMITLSATLSFYQPRVRELKRTVMHYMDAFIRQRDILAFDNTNSVLGKLTILKREYCDLNNGSIEKFLEAAEAYIRRFILAYSDGSELLKALEKGDGYVDKEIDGIIVKVCRQETEHLIAIFEKTYESIADSQFPHVFRDFAGELKTSYFQGTDLYAHFYSRLKDPKAVSA